MRSGEASPPVDPFGLVARRNLHENRGDFPFTGCRLVLRRLLQVSEGLYVSTGDESFSTERLLKNWIQPGDGAALPSPGGGGPHIRPLPGPGGQEVKCRCSLLSSGCVVGGTSTVAIFLSFRDL